MHTFYKQAVPLHADDCHYLDYYLLPLHPDDYNHLDATVINNIIHSNKRTIGLINIKTKKIQNAINMYVTLTSYTINVQMYKIKVFNV